jgi:hypothetical protein
VGLRLARLLGDPAVQAKARAVLDDRTNRVGLERGALFDPTSDSARADLAVLDAR